MRVHRMKVCPKSCVFNMVWGLCTCVITVYFLWFRVFVNVRLLRVLWNVVASLFNIDLFFQEGQTKRNN